MGSHIGLQVLASTAALCIGISYYLSQRSAKPPGPRGWPIIGNLFGVPTEFEWLHWSTYKELYGAVSYTTVLGKEIVILNTLEACNDMLDKRSSVYSGRPIMPFAGEIVGWDQQLLLVTYGKHFPAAYHEVQETEVKYLISRLHGDPEGLVKNLRITIGAILLRMSHGYTTRIDGNDPIVNLVEIASQDFYQATKPGAWLVDIIPWLKHIPAWIPGAGFKKTGAKYLKTNVDQTDLPYNFVLKELSNKTALPSFTSNALRSGELTADEKYALKYIAAALYGGGLDTVLQFLSSLISSAHYLPVKMTGATTVFFLAMVLFPDVQRKAQEELDRVVGTSRLPTIRDQEHLPYIAAIQKEMYRWRTTVPGGVPHAATEDDVYNGFFIRKGTIIINNLWAIAHDPDHYQDPMAFKPERFLGDAPELDPGIYTFGFGRRRCPGIEVAESTVFIIMATCLSVFRFGNAKDEAGNEVPPLDEFVSGAVCHPKPFKCSIEPRSADALHLLQTLESELPERSPSQL
ncbi:O-methylsterigmatocystin oxidoreductase [Mycena venus]|uniref:O-methylsterigmatocystin oxidoreductase n=1 Tax=Mycena venus TaxID=2733690 RepID=A0A8H6Z3I3_9AGAR|nr:O-methylsterigmatocystin oxidoreductase [Mycena venus]